MDEQSPPRRSESADREMSARAAGSGGAAPASGTHTDRKNLERIDAVQTARFMFELRSPNGQAISRSASSDPWRALHEFSGVASQDLGRRLGVGASAQLTDRDGVHGARLEVDGTGSNQLKFDTDEGRGLYKQVYRERQLALSQTPMRNRIEAVAPETEQSPSVDALSRIPTAAISTIQLRQAVLERLAQRAEPETIDERQQQERDRQIVSRASGVQLSLIAAELPKEEPAQLRKVLDRVQREVETSMRQAQLTAESRSNQQARPDSERVEGETEQAKRRLQNDPPIRERFTAIEHSWRTDYWQRDRPDRLGFTEAWLTLKTAEHSAAVIMGMVDRARERGWTKLHLDGSPEFKREAWILATARGFETSGYTAILGDREAAKVEQRRLSQPSEDRSRSAPAEEWIAHRYSNLARQATSSGERTTGPAKDLHLNAAVTKAMKDARVPAGLQARLREMITAEAQRRQATAPQWRAQVYDSAAPRSRSAPEIAARPEERDRQQER